jgi:hypothetical protein
LAVCTIILKSICKAIDAVKVCEGEFKDNVLHGKGKVTTASGKVWEAEYKDGEIIYESLSIDGNPILTMT